MEDRGEGPQVKRFKSYLFDATEAEELNSSPDLIDLIEEDNIQVIDSVINNESRGYVEGSHEDKDDSCSPMFEAYDSIPIRNNNFSLRKPKLENRRMTALGKKTYKLRSREGNKVNTSMQVTVCNQSISLSVRAGKNNEKVIAATQNSMKGALNTMAGKPHVNIWNKSISLSVRAENRAVEKVPEATQGSRRGGLNRMTPEPQFETESLGDNDEQGQYSSHEFFKSQKDCDDNFSTTLGQNEESNKKNFGRQFRLNERNENQNNFEMQFRPNERYENQDNFGKQFRPNERYKNQENFEKQSRPNERHENQGNFGKQFRLNERHKNQGNFGKQVRPNERYVNQDNFGNQFKLNERYENQGNFGKQFRLNERNENQGNFGKQFRLNERNENQDNFGESYRDDVQRNSWKPVMKNGPCTFRGENSQQTPSELSEVMNIESVQYPVRNRNMVEDTDAPLEDNSSDKETPIKNSDFRFVTASIEGDLRLTQDEGSIVRLKLMNDIDRVGDLYQKGIPQPQIRIVKSGILQSGRFGVNAYDVETANWLLQWVPPRIKGKELKLMRIKDVESACKIGIYMDGTEKINTVSFLSHVASQNKDLNVHNWRLFTQNIIGEQRFLVFFIDLGTKRTLKANKWRMWFEQNLMNVTPLKSFKRKQPSKKKSGGTN